MRFGWFGAFRVPDLLEPNSDRVLPGNMSPKALPDSPTLSYYTFYFNFETFFFGSVYALAVHMVMVGSENQKIL
jgi:hypothetical protein